MEHWESIPRFVMKCETCEEVVFNLIPNNKGDKLLYHRIRQFGVECNRCKEKRKELKNE